MRNKIYLVFLVVLASSFLFSGNLFAAKPDLGMYGFLKIGKFKKEVKWNKTIVLTPADAFLISNGKPAFDLYYSYREFDGAPARGFKNKVYFNGKMVSVQSNLSLSSKQIKSVHTQAYIGPNNGKLQIKIDADNNVVESRENNNFGFYVNIVFRGFNNVNKFKVTKVRAKVFPKSFSGKCPKKFLFKGYITVNGPGTVKYQWKRSDNAIAPIKTVKFAKAGTKVVQSSWTLSAEGTHWMAVAILSPKPMKSNKAVFKLKCKTATAPKKLPDLIVKNIKFVNNCKVAVTIKNIGQAGVPASYYTNPKAVGVQMYNNGKAWGGLILKGFDPKGKLKSPGGIVTYIWFPNAANLKFGTGINKIKVIVDNNRVLTESNENNNSLIKSLKCSTASEQTQRPVYSIYNIKMSPKSPAYLDLKQKVNITFKYKSSTAGIHIWARPMTGNNPTPKYAASGSKLYTTKNGTGSQYFMINSGKGIVNGVRFQIKDKNEKLLYTKIVRVKYKYPKPIVAKAPQRFFLDFNDAHLVYVPGSKTLQITTENNVLSYGSDWKKAKVYPYLYHLKQNVWKGFYWKINTSRKEAYLVKGNNFGKIGDSSESKINNITVNVVGGSTSTAPTRFLLKFKKSYLVFVPSSKTLQITAGNTVLSYGSDWKKCQLKPYLYQLKQNIWKGFKWQINTSRKIAQRIKGGQFCKIGGSKENLRMGVRVVN